MAQAPFDLSATRLCGAELDECRSPHRGQELSADDALRQMATMQVGTGRAVSDVAGELSCDWHTVNDAVMTYGRALLAADRRRLNATSAIGLDETSFVKLCSRQGRSYATTVADVANHQ
ncbi:hypothetical protein H7I94_00380, partial [Mycobacterium szulgai]|nr:hypothetical protein [Mycobacterium szulgai]